MREDTRDYQRQLEAQRETMLAKRDEDFEVRDKISNKNKLLNMALEENKVCYDDGVRGCGWGGARWRGRGRGCVILSVGFPTF